MNKSPLKKYFEKSALKSHVPGHPNEELARSYNDRIDPREEKNPVKTEKKYIYNKEGKITHAEDIPVFNEPGYVEPFKDADEYYDDSDEAMEERMNS